MQKTWMMCFMNSQEVQKDRNKVLSVDCCRLPAQLIRINKNHKTTINQ